MRSKNLILRHFITFSICSLVSISLSNYSAFSGEIFVWEDENGQIRYSKTQPPNWERKNYEKIEDIEINHKKGQLLSDYLKPVQGRLYKKNGYIVIEGLIINTSDKDIYDVEVVTWALDRNNKLIGITSSFLMLNPIRPDQISPFKMFIPFKGDPNDVGYVETQLRTLSDRHLVTK